MLWRYSVRPLTNRRRPRPATERTSSARKVATKVCCGWSEVGVIRRVGQCLRACVERRGTIGAIRQESTVALLGGSLSEQVKLPKYEGWNGYKEHLPRHVWRMGMSVLHGG